MAPIQSTKRARAWIDDRDSEVYGVETARSSNLRRTSNKRPHLSRADEDGDSEILMSDRSEDEGDRRPRTNGVADEDSDFDDYETRRDAGFEDLEFQEADDLRASQLVARKYGKTAANNQPADNAIIEEVICTNFMCHAHLQVQFGPLINFIIGHNGSGKSAVLTALTLCLGGKATATNRGQSLKSFIKEGQESATLSVRLKNQGPSAYQPELYGKSIIVERHFSRSGTSGFKIRNAQNKVISTKKADLEDITDAFALQLDNPMNVLTQDMARQFLNHSTARDKYKFFVKGTQLEQLDNDYKLMADNLDHQEEKLLRKEEDVKILQQEYEKAERKMQMADRQQTIQDKVRDYSRQMAWAQVEEQERYLQDMDGDIQLADQKIERLTGEADNVAQIHENATQAQENAKLAVEELRETLQPHQDELDRVLEEFNKNKKNLLKLQNDQRTIKGELQGAQKSVARIKKSIQEEHQRQASANGGQHAQKVAEIQDAKARYEEAQAAHIEHATHFRELDKQREEAETAVNKMKSVLEGKRSEVKRCEAVIHNLTRDQGQWITAYHPNMRNLLRAIDGERRFVQPPVGPLGRHVRLLKPEWSSILERSFGGALNSFVVTSKEDQSLLSELMRRTNCPAPVLIGDPAPIDTSRNEPEPHLDTWLRVLKIDNDLVRNQLIINQGIDQTVLIAKRREAMAFMTDGARPYNVRQCFTMHDTERRAGIRIAYSGGGGESSAPIKPWDQRPRMQTDTETQINLEQEALRTAKRELNATEIDLRELEKRLTQSRQAIGRHKRQNKDLNLQKQRAEDYAQRLQEELEEDTPQLGKVEALEKQLEEEEEAVATHSNSFQDAVEAKDRLNETQRALKDQLNGAQAEVDEINAKINKAEAKIQKLDEKRHDALLEKNRAFARVDDAKADKSQLQQKREQQQAVVDDFIRQASLICDRVRVDPHETPNSLDKKLEKLQNDLQRYQRELGGTRDELIERSLNARTAWETARQQLKALEDTSQLLKMCMSDRIDRWRKFRRFISSRARNTFTYLLSERSFRGTLAIMHDIKELDIQVEPDITRRSDKGRQTKTLSGGEKSFSTICLLLSLWDAMGSPIRCLDEFDVFMDNVNRDVSMKMMIQAARRATSRQFILITPQSMGNVAFQDDVKIIKMSDPERGQTALQFGR